MKKNNFKASRVVVQLLAWIFFGYVAIDLIHYIRFRASSIYPSFIEFPYESHLISYSKWIMSLLCFAMLYMNRSSRNWTAYVSWIISIVVLILFFFKGQFANAMVGSIVFRLGILEIAACGTIIYSIYFCKGLNLSWQNLSLGVVFAVGIYLVLLSSLPDFIMFE